MLGLLDRFSVDLDFDCKAKGKAVKQIQKEMEKIFDELELDIKDKSKNTLQYFLRYQAPDNSRNTIKIDTTMPPPKANIYQARRLPNIDRMALCQTRSTMFANKLVALIDRFEKHEKIAGRDLYDIHAFFMQGLPYNPEVVAERRKTSVSVFLRELIAFIEKHVTLTTITQDLSTLLPADRFQKIRKTLKQEILIFLKDELARIEIYSNSKQDNAVKKANKRKK